MIRACEHDTAPPRIALRPQEAANALGVSLRTIMAMEKAGEIPSVRIGKRNLRFPVQRTPGLGRDTHNMANADDGPRADRRRAAP